MKNTVEGYGVVYLVHFTQAENLSSIFENGILPISELQTRGISHNWNDEGRYDNCHDASSFSIEFPNYRYFYKLRSAMSEVDWVVLGIKSEVLWKKDCAFCKENAANKKESSIPINQRKGVNAFHRMFEECSGQPSRQEMGLTKGLPTNPQAEVLIFGNVEPDYIFGVAFDSKETKEKYKNLIPDAIQVKVANDLFKYRGDYKYWERESKIDG